MPANDFLSSPEKVLQTIWGYTGFRGIQKEVIQSVLDHKNTFVSMPTGGGKSLCYQIPVLCQSGIGIVVSPLIALMKDQIHHLKSVGIKATDLSSGLTRDEITQRIDNCLYGDYKFIYLSPERLTSEQIQQQLSVLNVNLIVIDEAHCISQWGHDFRPAYLKIAILKDLFPKAPMICLTASANEVVKNDILSIIKLPQISVFETSFERKNIAYSTFKVADKLHYVQKIIQKNKKAAIIYVRTRKATLDWAMQLQQLGISSTFYHGSLSSKEKQKNMSEWISDKAQVMVATNAFGMGIDKADVQSVIHLGIPENIENYYQESGRAGRDNKPAHAVILYTDSDIERVIYQTTSSLADKDFLLQFYKRLCSHLQIAYGEGFEGKFSFSLPDFCKKNDFNIHKAYGCLQFLDRQNCIEIDPNFNHKTSIQIIVSSTEIIHLIEQGHTQSHQLLTQLIRNYPGIYELEMAIDLQNIASKTNLSPQQTHQILHQLAQQQIISYQAQSTHIGFTMLENREDNYTINRIAKYLRQYNDLKQHRLNAIVKFVTEKKDCLNTVILDYFGEKKADRCGICSNCLKNKHQDQPITTQIEKLLTTENLTSKDIALVLQAHETEIVQAIQHLLSKEIIGINPENKYYLL